MSSLWETRVSSMHPPPDFCRFYIVAKGIILLSTYWPLGPQFCAIYSVNLWPPSRTVFSSSHTTYILPSNWSPQIQQRHWQHSLHARLWSWPIIAYLTWDHTSMFLRTTALACNSLALLTKFGIVGYRIGALGTWERIPFWISANDRGEPAVSYRWTVWVGEITGWSSRL